VEWYAQTATEPISEGVPVFVGCDVGWRNDTTAVVPLWARDEEYRQFGPARILEPPDNAGLHPDEIKRAFYEINERNPIEVVVMDMHEAEDIANWLSDEFQIDVIDHPQGNPQKVLDYQRFMEGLRQHQLWHSGDEGLRQHVFNATARMLPQGDFRFSRPKESRTVSSSERRRRVIDALDAASMVNSFAVVFPAPAEVALAFT
jgi:phage terminase large subunit-like protein